VFLCYGSGLHSGAPIQMYFSSVISLRLNNIYLLLCMEQISPKDLKTSPWDLCIQPVQSALYSASAVRFVFSQCSPLCIQPVQSTLYSANAVRFVFSQCSPLCIQPVQSNLYSASAVHSVFSQCSPLHHCLYTMLEFTCNIML
jgi:hypothetical protein